MLMKYLSRWIKKVLSECCLVLFGFHHLLPGNSPALLHDFSKVLILCRFSLNPWTCYELSCICGFVHSVLSSILTPLLPGFYFS